MNYKMVDVGVKPITHRIAIARGEIQLSPEVRIAIQENKVPKGDVIKLAEVAGIVAAKRTADILPLCHPLALDQVIVSAEIDEERNSILVSCKVSTHARTGVEMEALTGASAALLCIYDLTKGLDKGAVISGVMLEHKQGGKSGNWIHPYLDADVQSEELSGLRAAVIVSSDSCARGENKDTSGQIIVDYLKENQAEVVCSQILPDEIQEIRTSVEQLALKDKVDLIIITGGTGLGPRDVTPEALEPLWKKTLPGFGEVFRSKGLLNTPYSWLSRANAGLVDNTLVVLLPGSPGGVKDGLSVLHNMIPHMISMSKGGKH